ncbi:outer membrane protein assembly factor BamE [Alloalcanivorax sp. C16-2]|uniref:outer membrane protein assembly factor BamE n=1 Tax=Alloalcanivorax TaxID=3020832 RepID=UPI001933B6A2|nr:outer membrane protein assembly factor BamE [Alloalcanivorax marinus]MBL7252386.1 outer membrane protein assembly factor BamE [Alloalcanivorax marinus]
MPRTFLLSLLLAGLLTGCSSLRFPGVYRIDIPQGNVVTEDMLAELEPGMSPEQVRFVLGPPTLTDPFTPDTWYYLLHYQPGKADTVEQDIVVFFENGQYSHYRGEVVANVRERTSGRRDRELEQRAEDRREGNVVDQEPLNDPAPEPGAQSTPDATTVPLPRDG